MKKRILTTLAVLAVLICMFTISAAAATADSVSFTVGKDVENGLNGDVKITFSGSNNSFTGTLYLPGTAQAANLKMSWSSSSTVTVTVNNVTYASGEAPIPAAGSSLTYKVKIGTTTASYTVNTLQGSPTVEGLFINIEEDYGEGNTFSDLKSDPYHETSCFGTLSFLGKTYDMSIKGRGNWTWFRRTNGEPTSAVDKQPFNITLYKAENTKKGIARFDKKQKVEFINGVEAKKWSLLANYADGSMMRNKMGYDLACNLGIGLESRYIDIWVSGEYYGTYQMTPKSDYNAPDDGYMLELDNNLDSEDPYFALDGLEPAGSSDNVITVKSIGDTAAAKGVDAEVIQAWMQKALDAVMADSDEYLKYIDVDSWAKLYLVQEYCKNHDIICGSIFMHRDGLTENDKLIAGPVWDLDNAWGRIWKNDHSGIDEKVQFYADGWYIDAIDGYTSFLKYLGMHEDFMARVYELFNEYSWAFDATLTEVDQLKTEIAASVNDMNYERWDVYQNNYNATRITGDTTRGSGTYAYKLLKTDSWEDYVANLKSYMTARLKYMEDNLIVAAPAAPTVSGSTEIELYSKMTLTASGTADYFHWESSSDGGKTWTDIPGATGKTYTVQVFNSMNGMQFRCMAQKKGSVINTDRVAKAATRSKAVASQAVTLTVKASSHVHEYTTRVVSATCKHGGSVNHVCYCGDSYTDNETEKVDHSYKNGYCIYCGTQDPDYSPKCTYVRTVELKKGDLTFVVNGTEVGVYTFVKHDSGWTIQNSEGNYLKVSSGKLIYSTSSAYWTYSETAKTLKSSNYYLIYDSTKKALSVSTSSTGATVSFKETKTSLNHVFGAWQEAANEKHVHTCVFCGAAETEDCLYEEGEACVCGRAMAEPLGSLQGDAVSLILDNQINVAYYVRQDKLSGYDETYLKVIFKEKEYHINGAPYVKSGVNYTRFEFKNIAAKEIADEMSIYVVGVKDDVTYEGEEKTYSVKQYCMNKLNKSSDAELKTLCADLLNYGAAAQTFFDYHTDNLANKDMTAAHQTCATSALSTIHDVKGIYKNLPDATVKLNSLSLLLESAVAIKYYYKAPSEMAKKDLQFKVWKDLDGNDTEDEGEVSYITSFEFEAKEGYNECRVVFRDLIAQEMRKKVYITACDMNGQELSHTVRYSIEGYAYGKQNDVNPALAALVQSMMKYGDSTEAYFGD